MVQLLVAAGNALGDKAWTVVERTRHYPALFALIVGDTAKARKGTSAQWVLRTLGEAAPAWRAECTTTGLSTGEGLIERVRDPEYERNKKTGEMELVHTGFATSACSSSKQSSQDRSAPWVAVKILWPRCCGAPGWHPSGHHDAEPPDHGHGRVVSLFGHITVAELRDELAEVHADNGLANRLLFVAATRSKLLPLGGNLSDDDLTSVALKMRAAIKSCPAGRVRLRQSR